MKKNINFLLFIVFSFNYAQEAVQVNNETTFPNAISESGDSLFFSNWNSEDNGFLWKEGEGITHFVGGKSYDFSFGGNRLIGAFTETHDGVETSVAAYYDLETEQWVSLGLSDDIPVTSSSYSTAWGANNAGDKFVGLIFSANFTANAFVWTQETGYQILPNISEENNGSRANGISEYGDVIFGHIVKANGIWNSCVWSDNELVLLDNSDSFGDATCASFNGTYVAANKYKDILIWSAEGVETITFSDDDFSNAGLPIDEVIPTYISENKTVFGFINSFNGRVSFAYDDENGLTTLNTYLSNLGINDLDDFTFISTVAASPDLTTLSGSGYDASSQTATYVIHTQNMGVDDSDNQFSYMVYPTIVDDNVKVRFSKQLEKTHITITNVQGQVIFNKTIEDEKSLESIPMALYPAGIYHLTIQQGGTKKTTKLIKK